MFGSKLRSWMEAVRPRKKHRKDKTAKNDASVSDSRVNGVNKLEKSDKTIVLHNGARHPTENDNLKVNTQSHSQKETSASGVSSSRYSANNLSSPESAYSTGYSTDGASPSVPPDYLLSDPSKSDRYNLQDQILNSGQLTTSPINRNNDSYTMLQNHTFQLVSNRGNYGGPRIPSVQQKRELEDTKIVPAPIEDIISGPKSPSMGIHSPRQRNRIRTNPWLPTSMPSPIPTKHEISTPSIPKKINRDSPRSHRYLSPKVDRRHSLSSSSYSSLSGTSLSMEQIRPRSASDDEECTLNEMMGKYDESYIYEKETDILSDSDPTDCETDIDTGQDGGDEDDPFETELDFIDNGSHLEFEPRLDYNTGHCSYYSFDVSKKRSSRRRTARKSTKQSSDKKRRSSSNKKRISKHSEPERVAYPLDGSKSAGATPLSSRRAGHKLVSKRSNSICFYQKHLDTIDRRDKEADLKYKELITEAEQILRTMKCNGLSPRRMPGPPNKRVELLRSTECSKMDMFNKNRSEFTYENIADTTMNSKIPSNNGLHSRFSPKKSHVTNFLLNNSPILVKREWEKQNEVFKPHTPTRIKNEDNLHPYKDILQQENSIDPICISPRHKRYVKKRETNSSSESDDDFQRPQDSTIGCPQSEPVRRKVYIDYITNNTQKPQRKGKSVAFNLTNELNGYMRSRKHRTNSTENLKQEILLNTIVNLKRNLENQSASLKQVYKNRSSHNIYI